MQNKFMLPSINTEEQKKLVEKLSVVINTLGYKYIKVAQLKSDFQSVSGIVDVDYKENRDWEENNGERYKHSLIGNKTLDFVQDPYPMEGPGKGTGKVAYMIDDNMPVPVGSKSKATKGWNREFLASQYGSGVLMILDEEEDKEIKQRHDEIMANIENDKPNRDAILKRLKEREAIIRGRPAQSTEKIIEKHYMPTNPEMQQEENADLIILKKENAEMKAQLGELLSLMKAKKNDDELPFTDKPDKTEKPKLNLSKSIKNIKKEQEESFAK